MPRSARLDAPGVVHHVIIRGIERRNIFEDDRDRDNLLERLAILLPETRTQCFAWALMPNHAHFLLRSGPGGLPTLMRRLLTGYAVSFNRRHQRSGQLFQNRYKSIICQEELYLKELVRYIHLNPLRAKLVANFEDLERYSYCGHAAVLGNSELEWQNTGYVLGYFGQTTKRAQLAYLEFMEAGIRQGRRSELVGGGLVRSLGGWTAVKESRSALEHMKGDERILGNADFIDAILLEARETYDRRYELKRRGIDLDSLAGRVAQLYGVEPEYMMSSGRQKKRVEARSLLCYWAVRQLGITLTELARRFELTPSAVGYAVERGERIAERKGFKLMDSY